MMNWIGYAIKPVSHSGSLFLDSCCDPEFIRWAGSGEVGLPVGSSLAREDFSHKDD